MQTECARQLCDGEAVAVCAIDPSATTVVLLPLETSVVGSPLCRRHTDGLRPPSGWQLRDERPKAPLTTASTISSDAPGAPDVPDASEAPGPPQARESVDAAATAPSSDDGFTSLLEAETPLLSRAFRTAGH